MAKVYSWEVSTNPYKYAYIVHPDDTSKAYVGDELNSDNLQKVTNWVAECSDEDYEAHFEMVKKLCKEKNYSVKFENVNAYMDVDASCDNLRGPAGRGIDSIVLDEDNSSEFVDIYIINYTDGTKSNFEVRHGKPGGSGGTGDPDDPEGSGDVSVSTYFAMIYTSGKDKNGETKEVTTPTGGKYDWVNYKLEPPEGWQEHDSVNGGNALEPPVWMSTRTFVKDHDDVGGWSIPTVISGKDGKPGVDSDDLEFIYTQVKPPTEGKDIENDIETKEYQKPGHLPPTGGWTNRPQGVDENNRTEWFTIREYDEKTGKWGVWADPAIWSQYGVNGQDGDGVEYIYYLDNTGERPRNPTPSDYTSNAAYKKDEWTPSDMGGKYTNIDKSEIKSEVAVNWKDNPTGVDPKNQWEWVAVRKYKGTTKEWGPFSDPSLWSKYGETGANAFTIRKVYKMTDSTSEEPTPPTNNYYTDWSDAFPVDYKKEDCVWCCEAEIWAHNNEFVKRYARVSIVNEKNEIVAPSDATKGDTGNTLESYGLPEKNILEDKKYLFNAKDGHYYIWKEGWSKPYLVTGTKGDSAEPMDYVTYVFYYGERNNPPKGKPIGETGEGKTLKYIETFGWHDFPDTKNGERVDNDINCWYQCCLSMYSNNTIKSWGGIHPCNGKDGNALPGKYTEFRFAVTTNNSDGPDKPDLTDEDRNERSPISKHKGTNITWKATNEDNFPTVNEDQTMWQIFAVIDYKDGDYVLDGTWQGPIQVSAENGKDSDKVGPAGKQGVSGIPGANFKVKYCLGTFSEKTGECYWKLDDLGNGDLSTSAYSQIIEYAKVSDNVGKIVRLTSNSSYNGKTYYVGYYYIKSIGIVEQIKGWDNDPAVRKLYGSGYFGKDPSKFNNLDKGTNYWFDFPPNSEIIKFDKSDFGDYKSKAYEGRVIRRKFDSNRYALSFIYYHEEAKIYTNQDITTTTLTLEEAENFHVYVWCVQGTEKWKKGENKDNKGELIDENIPDGIEWGIPFKIQGTNGLDGLKGADGRSQTVYPMGIYSSNEVYLTTESKAPYVYDANDGNFYVLNRANEPWVGDLPAEPEKVIVHPPAANTGNTDNTRYETAPLNKTKEFVIVTGHTEYISGNPYSGNDFYYQWDGKKYVPASYYKYVYNSRWITVDQNGTTPSQNYLSHTDPAWVKFESFDALYTSIGIIENGMIGSAVYNNEFMFSQQGINATGGTTDYATESAKKNGGFLSGYEYDKKGEVDNNGVPTGRHWKYNDNFIDNDEVNPYEMKVTPNSTTPVHSFRPNITLNFKTGQAYLSTGEITFGNGVMTAHTGIFNNVVVNGTYNTQVLVINDTNKDEYIHEGYLLLSNVPDIVIFECKDVMTLKLPYYYPVYYYADLFPNTEYVNDEEVYIFTYKDNATAILAEIPSGREGDYYQVKDYNKISIGNLCYHTDYGYKKEGGKYVINNLTDVRSYIGREMYFFNKGGGNITIECGEVFTTNKELDKFVRVSSVNYADEWVLPVISAKTGTQDDFTYNPEKLGDNDKLYENYIMHARHPAMTDNNGNVPNYEQENIVIYPKNLCIAKCDIGNYTYVAKKKLPNGQSVDATYRNNLLGWRFNMVDDDMRDIYYNDSYLKYVHIGNLQGNKECEFKIVSDWTWNTYLSSSFEGTDKFMYDENGYVKYKVNDNKSYYLVNNNNPKDTAHLNQSIIIGASNTYYFSGTIVN